MVLMTEWADIWPRLVEALIVAFVLWLAKWTWDLRKASHARDQKLDRLLAYHEGIPADPITGEAAIPSVAAQLEEVTRQVTPNGGDSDTLADRVVRVESLAHKALSQGSTALDAVKGIQEADKRTAQQLESVNERLDQAEDERREIMSQSLEGWKRFSKILNIEPGDPPWIKWTKDNPGRRREDRKEGENDDGTV
jgi:hypothetical protein